MERFKDHLQILLALHYVGAHDEPSSLIDDLLIDFLILCGCIDIVLGLGQLFLQVELYFTLLDQLVVKLSFSGVICSCDILLFLSLLLFELLQLGLSFTTLPSIVGFLLDSVHDLLNYLPLLLLKVIKLPIELLDLTLHLALFIL